MKYIMLNLIKSLKLSMVFRFGICIAIMPEKCRFQKCLQAGRDLDWFQIYCLWYSQQNDHVEWKFITLFNKLCALLNNGKFSTFLRSGSWARAVNTANLLENNLFTPNRDFSPFQQFFGKGPRNILSLVQKISWNAYHHIPRWFPITFGLVSPKVILSVPIVCTTSWQKIVEQKTWHS